jgi:hypothetical protein
LVLLSYQNDPFRQEGYSIYYLHFFEKKIKKKEEKLKQTNNAFLSEVCTKCSSWVTEHFHWKFKTQYSTHHLPKAHTPPSLPILLSAPPTEELAALD